MSAIALITALFKLVGFVAKWATDRQLISAGEARAAAASAEASLENLRRAKEAKDAIRNDRADADWAQRVRDKYTRNE